MSLILIFLSGIIGGLSAIFLDYIFEKKTLGTRLGATLFGFSVSFVITLIGKVLAG